MGEKNYNFLKLLFCICLVRNQLDYAYDDCFASHSLDMWLFPLVPCLINQSESGRKIVCLTANISNDIPLLYFVLNSAHTQEMPT